jgi:hypothetical protein
VFVCVFKFLSLSYVYHPCPVFEFCAYRVCASSAPIAPREIYGLVRFDYFFGALGKGKNTTKKKNICGEVSLRHE